MNVLEQWWKIWKLLPNKTLNIKKPIKKYYYFTILIRHNKLKNDNFIVFLIVY